MDFTSRNQQSAVADEDAAVRELKAGDGSTVKEHVLNVAASRDIDGLRQGRAVPNINRPEQLVVAEVQFFQVSIALASSFLHRKTRS